ncbi:MAG: NYN domain-containing protein [Ignavibacteria bacterium]|nr:NYN domain-containing protein [Ignavibacteria bacterium]
METIIIDAYNLMHKAAELQILLQQSQDICVDTMVTKLKSHYFGKSIKCVLVFDGFGKNKHDGNIDVKFSKTSVGPDYGQADALIKHLIEKSRNPRLLKVVSSDREVTSFAKECGSRILSSESFWGEVKEKRITRIEAIRESKEKPDVVTQGEFEFLLKEFTKK